MPWLMALMLIFITLRLCGVINWSWVLVLLPGLAWFFALFVYVLCREMRKD